MSTILHAVFLFELDPHIKAESSVEPVVEFNFILYLLPETCKLASGAIVPIPTLPSDVILILSVWEVAVLNKIVFPSKHEK